MTVKQQYQKQRARVRSLINRYKKLGYEVDIAIPKIPKRITTASVNRLAKITAEKVRKKSYAPSPDTGDILNYYQFKHYAKRSGNPKITPKQLYDDVSRETLIPDTDIYPDVSRETLKLEISTSPDVSRETFTRTDEEVPFWEDIVISNFRDVIEQMQYQQLTDIAKGWLNRNIEQHGETKTAEMLQTGADRGVYSRLEAAYRENDVLGILTEMLQFMDISAGEKTDIMREYYENGDIFEEYYD